MLTTDAMVAELQKNEAKPGAMDEVEM